MAIVEHYSMWFYAAWCAAGGVLVYQQSLIRSRNPQVCLRAFSMSCAYGIVMWFGLISAQWI
ncbi:MAG TPA: hypothetical protein DDY37_03655 [Legionella sp.]|nr:hypothetical protein [Legionella sp.]